MSRSGRLLKWINVLVLLLLLSYVAYRSGWLDGLWSRRSAPVEAPLSLAPGLRLDAVEVHQGSWFTVFFTRPRYPDRPEGRHGGLDEVFVADLDRAQHSIDIAVFDLDLPRVVEALLRAHRRGVRLRLVLDAENLSDPRMARAVQALQQAGIPIRWDEREAFMHNKFAILDGRVLWTGSWNMTENDTYRNNNNMLRVSIPELVANYVRRFEHLFEGRMGQEAPRDTPYPVVTLSGPVRIETYFSPGGGAAQAIEDRLSRARERIYVMAFAFTADAQARLLIEKHRQGLLVRGVFESRNVQGSGSDFARLRRAGLDVREDTNPYIMHHKVYVIDGRIVITGSYNFTASAERANDENLLIIEDPELARYYEEEFARLYEQAQARAPIGSGRPPARP
jgi:phosphatidylserine/phosphatidylglycerophosphate/cardiolipin synthase-like enzyme|nr:MAG: phospholipase [Bacteroidota bacterium]